MTKMTTVLNAPMPMCECFVKSFEGFSFLCLIVLSIEANQALTNQRHESHNPLNSAENTNEQFSFNQAHFLYSTCSQIIHERPFLPLNN